MRPSAAACLYALMSAALPVAKNEWLALEAIYNKATRKRKYIDGDKKFAWATGACSKIRTTFGVS